MTGPSRAIQITAAATSDRTEETERMAGARAAPGLDAARAGLTAQLTCCYPLTSAFIAAGTALASPVIVGVIRLYPSFAYSARPAGDSA